MLRVRSLTTALLVASTLFGAAAAYAKKPEKGAPCKHQNAMASVKAACAKGGMLEAHTLMEGYKKALKGKADFVCGDCHNQDSWALKDNAKADFDKLKAAHPDIIK